MILINEIVFPGKIGKANELSIQISNLNMEDNSTWVNYRLRDIDTKEEPPLPLFKVLNSGRLFMDEETYNKWGTDDAYIINWVAEQLGVVIIQQSDIFLINTSSI